MPDWVAHRLWIGTILFLGGLGVRWAARQLGLAARRRRSSPALVYQLVAVRAAVRVAHLGDAAAVGRRRLARRARPCAPARRTRWRDAALFALVVLTVGAVNATALALIAPAPILWLVHAAWQRTITWRTALVTAAKLGGLSASLVSLWWIVMLVVQGRHGADVLAFSRDARGGVAHVGRAPRRCAASATGCSTSATRTRSRRRASIAVHGLGPSSSSPATRSLVLALLGIAAVRWSQRRYAALLVFAGVVLAVGVHPIDDPSPLMAPLTSSALGLALRSSTRALPLFQLGVGARRRCARRRCRAAAGGAARQRWVARRRALGRPRARRACSRSSTCRRCASGGFVDPALERDQDVPAAWAGRGRRARRRVDASTACCSSRARSSARSAGATRSTRRCRA